LELRELARRLAGGFAVLLGRGELGGNLGDETLVLGQAEQKIDPVGLTPAHQGLTSKPRSGAQLDAHLRAMRADLGNDARRFLHCPGGRIDVGAPQL